MIPACLVLVLGVILWCEFCLTPCDRQTHIAPTECIIVGSLSNMGGHVGCVSLTERGMSIFCLLMDCQSVIFPSSSPARNDSRVCARRCTKRFSILSMFVEILVLQWLTCFSKNPLTQDSYLLNIKYSISEHKISDLSRHTSVFYSRSIIPGKSAVEKGVLCPRVHLKRGNNISLISLSLSTSFSSISYIPFCLDFAMEFFDSRTTQCFV